jgi:hypothetical protein
MVSPGATALDDSWVVEQEARLSTAKPVTARAK